MNRKISNRGMGKRQARTLIENRKNILKVLIDNDWHEYKEIRDRAKISNVTLSEHLRQLKPLLKRKEDKITYPHRVSYKINKWFAMELARGLTIGLAWKEIEERFLKTKDFWVALEQINAINNVFLLTVLGGLKENKDLRGDPEIIHLLLETFVWESFESLTWNLMEASEKVIDKVDFEAISERMRQDSLKGE